MLEQFKESASFIQSRTNVKPSIGIILGTGLGGLVKEIKVIDEISYQNTDNNNINNDDKNENNKQSSQSIVKKIDYSPIANDYSNLCALNNKVKK